MSEYWTSRKGISEANLLETTDIQVYLNHACKTIQNELIHLCRNEKKGVYPEKDRNLTFTEGRKGRVNDGWCFRKVLKSDCSLLLRHLTSSLCPVCSLHLTASIRSSSLSSKTRSFWRHRTGEGIKDKLRTILVVKGPLGLTSKLTDQQWLHLWSSSSERASHCNARTLPDYQSQDVFPSAQPIRDDYRVAWPT